MKTFFLISTAHLEDALWFRDDEDFIAGMNYVAIVAFVHKNVVVYAFILMSNHVHFVVYGELEDVKEFIRDYKIRYSKYYGNRYGTNNFLRRNDIDIREIAFETEDVKRAIAYVLMNCVAANICTHPSQYPWGSGNVAFQVGKSSGKPLGSYSARGLRRILHSAESSLPNNWIIGEHGFILPQNFIPVKNLENIFRTPQGMNYFFNNSSKAKKILSSEDNLPAFTDQTIFKALPELLRSLFQKSAFAELTRVEQTECLRQIRYRFSADITQAARVCGVSYAEAAKLFDQV